MANTEQARPRSRSSRRERSAPSSRRQMAPMFAILFTARSRARSRFARQRSSPARRFSSFLSAPWRGATDHAFDLSRCFGEATCGANAARSIGLRSRGTRHFNLPLLCF